MHDGIRLKRRLKGVTDIIHSAAPKAAWGFPVLGYAAICCTGCCCMIYIHRMKNAPLKFAWAALSLAAVWILFEHLMGWNTTRHDIGQYARLVPMISFWIMLVLAIWYVRRSQGNALTFRQGFEAGLVMTLVYCAGFTVIIMLYQQFLNPEYYQTLKEFTIHQLQRQQLPQQKIDEVMKELEQQAGGSSVSYLLLFLFASIWGIGISAIASMMLRRTP
jgi:hypothetical protein